MDLLTILDEKGIVYKRTNNPDEIVIQCTSGLHTDKNPSLAYNLDRNIFKCWSCSFSGGSKKFLRSIGIITTLPVESRQPTKVLKMRQKLNRLLTKDIVELPEDMRPAIGTFKGINIQTMKEFQAFFTEKYGLTDYVCFPIYQFGKLRYIEARLKFKPQASSKNKYNRFPPGSETVDMLFPLDKLNQYNEIILVEGIFDMLNLYQYGYHNVLTMFGTGFGKIKLDLLDRIGTNYVHLMLDGDQPGRTAAFRITEQLEKKDIAVNEVKLPEGKDPGNLDFREIEYYLGKPKV